MFVFDVIPSKKKAKPKRQVFPKIFSVFLTLLLIFELLFTPSFTLPKEAKASSTWLEGYTYRTSIEIQGSTTGLTNYQVMLTIQGNNSSQANYIDFDKVKQNGDDIRFTKSDKITLISYWIQSWNDTTKQATIWIKVPSIPTTGTTIYMYCGKADATSQSSGSNTFELFNVSGIQAFYHMDEESWNGTTGEVIDEKGVNNGTAKEGANTTANGKFNRGGSFDGFDDYVNVSHSSSLSPNNYTVSFYAKDTATIPSERVFLTKGIGDITYRVSALPDNTIKATVQDASENFSRVGAITLETGENYLYSAVIDPKGEYAYFGTDTSPGKVVKVRLSDFTRVGAITFNTGENNPDSVAIDPKGEYAYFGTATSPGIVVKVRLSDFTRVGAITFETGENYLYSAVIDPKGEYAYFGTDTSPGKVVKVRLSDFTRVGAITFETGEDGLYAAVVDPRGEYAYFGTWASPAEVIKIRLSDFTRVGAITLNTGENDLDSAVIDPKGEYAYFDTDTNPIKVVKIRLSDFTRVGALTLETGEDWGWGGNLIDSKGEFVYFGACISPGKIIKVRLSDFTRVGAITFNTGENYPDAAVIDPKGEYAYFATETSPGVVIKVRLSDFTTDSVISSTALSGSFAHIAIVKDASNLKLYVNGSLEDSTPLTVSIPTVTDDLKIGSRGQWLGVSGRFSSWFPTTFEGTIDEVAIFNRALGADEISALSGNYMEKIGNYFGVRKYTLTEPTTTTGAIYGYKKFFKGVVNTIFPDGSVLYSSDPELSDELLTSSLSITPSHGSIDVEILTWLTSDTYYKKWKEEASDTDITAIHVVGDLESDTSYEVKVDGKFFNTYTSNDSGQITFTYDKGYSEKTFEVAKEELAPTGEKLSYLIFALPFISLIIGFALYFKPNLFKTFLKEKRE